MLKKEQQTVTSLNAKIEQIRKEHATTKSQLQKTQEEHARSAELLRETERRFQLKEQELQSQIDSAQGATRAESEAKAQLMNILSKGKEEYDRLLKMAHAERETIKQLRNELAAASARYEKAQQDHALALKTAHESRVMDEDQAKRTEKEIRTRDEEVLRLQEQLIKLRRNLKDADDARKSTQYLANQLKAELTEAHTEITRLRNAQPLKVLLENKQREIHEISNQLSELGEGNPRRAHLISRLDNAIQERSSVERLFNEASPSSNN
jgi:chromosome segregation ATPase